MTPEAPGLHNSSIDLPRLYADLELTEEKLKRLRQIGIPDEIVVSSASLIKIHAVSDALTIAFPGRIFDVKGVSAKSSVDEGPIGMTTVVGALNRFRDTARIIEQGEYPTQPAIITMESGVFQIGGELIPVDSGLTIGWSIFYDDVNFSPKFDQRYEYSDRVVTAISILRARQVIQISPTLEAVGIPAKAMIATSLRDGGFVEHSVGETLLNMGLVRNKQDPQSELTQGRIGGPLPRTDQMMRAILRGLLQVAN